MDSLTPQEKINLDTYSDEDTVRRDYDKQGFNSLENRLIPKYFTEKGKVLDIGCGAGRTTKPLQDMGMDVVGVDFSPTMIKVAKEKNPELDLRVMNACSLDFDDNTFEYVLFSFNGIDNIYPFEKRLQCFKEVWRVLKEDGLFMFSSHNAWNIPRNRGMLSVVWHNIWNLKIFSQYRVEKTDDTELHMYANTPTSEKKNLINNGFKVIEVRGAKYCHIVPMTLFELAPYYVVQKV